MTSRKKASALVALVACVVSLGACSGDADTGGSMHSVDDTGRPPSPIEEGWMVALPASEATWDLLGARPESGHIERTAKIERGDVLDAGGVWQPLGARGSFELPVTPGEWAVCYLPNPDDAGPLGVAGCNVLQLEEGSRIDASWGESGFWAELD